MADSQKDGLMPPKIYLLLTSYRIDAAITARVVSAAIREAIACDVPVMIVASIVEMADEFLYKDIFIDLQPPEHVRLHIIRIPGTGKRDALAQGFKAISRDAPPPGAVVAVIDGDTVLGKGVLKHCAPFFALRPAMGALTTDEVADGLGGRLYREWHSLRFAQRHILMSSIALSRHVMTLTGRMSMYRAKIVTDPRFIDHMANDYLDHWRLGRFRFLTGDDKSSLYWLIQEGWEQMYVPDVLVTAMETPPSRNFFKGSTMLMFRWFGNMLRTNTRILRLGPRRMPLFVWWSFLDQRLSMWTSLTGPVFTVMLSFQYGVGIVAYYFVWVGFVRGVMTLVLLSARPRLSWYYPFLLYYNQIYGGLMKTWVLFHLDRQSWTRQKIRMDRGFSGWKQIIHEGSSLAVQATAYVFFILAIGLMTGVWGLPMGVFRSWFI